MKISSAVLAAVVTAQDREARRDYRALLAEKVRTFNPDRFVYEWPMCPDVQTCVDNFDGCDGRTVNGSLEPTGSIEHRAYADRWNCRWEIEAAPGHTVGLKFWNDFDLEFHGACGFDRLQIRCLDTQSGSTNGLNKPNTGAPLARLCGPKNPDAGGWPKDALTNFPKGTFFKSNADTGCKHVIIEMNTDQDLQGENDRDGFTLGWSLYPDANANPNPCKATTATVISVSNCIKQESKRVGRTEFQYQVDNANTARDVQKLEKQRAKRMANLDKHVDNYMSRTMTTISRCGQGLSVSMPASVVNMVNNPPNDTADGWFKIWNTFVTQVLTGDAVTCGWYDSSLGADGIDQSSFPCRTRRIFVKMQGFTQNGQTWTCNAGDFHTYDL